MRAAWTIIVAAVLSFGQTTAKKETPPTTKNAIAPAAKPDTWQRSKECAVQAEKVVADWPKRTGGTPADWHNHYSPKYEKCFVTLDFSQFSKDEKSFPSIFSTALIDAFERAPIANTCTLLRGNSDCAQQIFKTMRDSDLESYSKNLNGKSFGEGSAAEQEAVRKLVGDASTSREVSTGFCKIDAQPADCAKAANFIVEHMKN